MSDAIRVYCTGDCDGFEDLREALAEHEEIDLVGQSEQVGRAAGVLAGGHLDCVLHATSDGAFPATELAAIREHTRAPVIVVASGGDAVGMLDDALDQDVSDFLLLPQLISSVVFAIRKAAHARRRVQETTGRVGRVVTVFSPKGGTGKTVLATNLAVALATKEGRRTLLIDLDLQFGDAAIMLGMEPEKTIFDLVVAPGELDSEKLAGYVTRHPCGLDLLAAPLRPEDAELVIERKVTGLLDVARSSYEAIVVDTSPFFHGPMLTTLDRTDELLVLCGLDVPTLKNVRLALQTLELLSFPSSRLRYVLNRSDSSVGLKIAEVEEALKVKIASQIPNERMVPVCVNRGTVAMLAEPRTDFSKAVAALAKQVAPSVPAKSKRKRILSAARAA